MTLAFEPDVSHTKGHLMSETVGPYYRTTPDWIMSIRRPHALLSSLLVTYITRAVDVWYCPAFSGLSKIAWVSRQSQVFEEQIQWQAKSRSTPCCRLTWRL